MAKKTDEYRQLQAEINSGDIGTCYILHGEERYLLERCVADIRAGLLPNGGGFNHRKYDTSPDINELREAVETFPLFAERTLIEIYNFDFGSGLDNLLPILRELPEHVCILFVCGAEWKLDRRLSASKELLKLARCVDFKQVERERLVPWISRHFREHGCTVTPSDAEYLAFLTGGLMTTLRLEIEKLAAHSGGGVVTRGDMDEHIAAEPDAVLYKLTDAVADGNFGLAAQVLGELIAMREPAHKIIYAMTSKLRALLLARHYLSSGKGVSELMRTADVRYEFQAKNLLSAARRVSLSYCETAVRMCAEAAFRLNDGSGIEAVTELVARLAERRVA